jgi:hypothetical protein
MPRRARRSCKPTRGLVWEDAAGKTWLSYNDPSLIAKRHGLGPDMSQTIDAMVAGLGAAINGRRDQLEGKLQERYGYAKDEVRQEINDWLEELRRWSLGLNA